MMHKSIDVLSLVQDVAADRSDKPAIAVHERSEGVVVATRDVPFQQLAIGQALVV